MNRDDNLDLAARINNHVALSLDDQIRHRSILAGALF